MCLDQQELVAPGGDLVYADLSAHTEPAPPAGTGELLSPDGEALGVHLRVVQRADAITVFAEYLQTHELGAGQ